MGRSTIAIVENLDTMVGVVGAYTPNYRQILMANQALGPFAYRSFHSFALGEYKWRQLA